MTTSPTCRFDEQATRAMATWRQQVTQGAITPFDAAQQIMRRLGAQFSTDGECYLGFWTPELPASTKSGISDTEELYLEVITPLEPVDFRSKTQTFNVRIDHLPVVVDHDYCWCVVKNMQAGTRDQSGAYYWLKYKDSDGHWQIIRDPLAHSVPFGASSPAEAYDMLSVHADRADADYFPKIKGKTGADGVVTRLAPVNILQLHPGTATKDGTLEGLNRHYQRLAEKIRQKKPLTPAESCFVDYDAVQLTPLEPTIEFEAGTDFWTQENNSKTSRVTVKAPDMTNWGYDVMTLGSPAVAATVTASKRPDELVDLISTLHNFPGQPIRVIFDIVYGHTDNQAAKYLNETFFAGDNMYGKNLNYRHPVVRAMLLEMQRRKSNFGIDGLRVDGAQDFKIWDPVSQQLYHDDEYLQAMSDIPVEVGSERYHPWMIFEDGRPWPRDDWELSSTYREVIRQQPDVVQWGPLTFAHNTPFLFSFWVSKWWRIREIAEVGSHWITGCANHDTLRRGTQVEPSENINTYLADNLPDIIRKAYDNPASHLLDYAMLPGIPMEFINASTQSPWSFMRNIDDRYGVKVMAEEANFSYWAITEEDFARKVHFKRLKAQGFKDLDTLRQFLVSLRAFVEITDYDLSKIVTLLGATDDRINQLVKDVPGLKAIACDWMDDVHDYCNVSHWQDRLDAAPKAVFTQARNFRRARPELRNNLRNGDFFDYLHPSEGAVVFCGYRKLAASGEEILFIANMEGSPREITAADLPIPDLPQDGWQSALMTPGLTYADFAVPLFLSDSEGVVFVRRQ